MRAYNFRGLTTVHKSCCVALSNSRWRNLKRRGINFQCPSARMFVVVRRLLRNSCSGLINFSSTFSGHDHTIFNSHTWRDGVRQDREKLYHGEA